MKITQTTFKKTACPHC